MARPRVLLNCAVDRHGRVAGPGGEPVRISSEEDMRRVHRLRAGCDAILVGVETVLRDDPGLHVDQAVVPGADPMAVILDSRLRTPPSARVARRGTRIYHHQGQGPVGEATLVRVPAGGGGVDLDAVLADLAAHGVASVLVEGGPRVLRSFVEARRWDSWTVFQADMDLGDGPALWGGLPQAWPELHAHRCTADGGVLWTFSP